MRRLHETGLSLDTPRGVMATGAAVAEMASGAAVAIVEGGAAEGEVGVNTTTTTGGAAEAVMGLRRATHLISRRTTVRARDSREESTSSLRHTLCPTSAN